jgi:hypothetical protein
VLGGTAPGRGAGSSARLCAGRLGGRVDAAGEAVEADLRQVEPVLLAWSGQLSKWMYGRRPL